MLKEDALNEFPEKTNAAANPGRCQTPPRAIAAMRPRTGLVMYLQAAKACNWRCAIIGRPGAEGAIDLLRDRDGTLVFVEGAQPHAMAVWRRRGQHHAIKQQRIIFAARHYLMLRRRRHAALTWC